MKIKFRLFHFNSCKASTNALSFKCSTRLKAQSRLDQACSLVIVSLISEPGPSIQGSFHLQQWFRFFLNRNALCKTFSIIPFLWPRSDGSSSHRVFSFQSESFVWKYVGMNFKWNERWLEINPFILQCLSFWWLFNSSSLPLFLNSNEMWRKSPKWMIFLPANY